MNGKMFKIKKKFEIKRSFKLKDYGIKTSLKDDNSCTAIGYI